jgi:hypothetical protein
MEWGLDGSETLVISETPEFRGLIVARQIDIAERCRARED